MNKLERLHEKNANATAMIDKAVADVVRLQEEKQELIATLRAAIDLIDTMLDEILALHRHSREPLPMRLLEAKDIFDRQIKNILNR